MRRRGPVAARYAACIYVTVAAYDLFILKRPGADRSYSDAVRVAVVEGRTAERRPGIGTEEQQERGEWQHPYQRLERNVIGTVPQQQRELIG